METSKEGEEPELGSDVEMIMEVDPTTKTNRNLESKKPVQMESAKVSCVCFLNGSEAFLHFLL